MKFLLGIEDFERVEATPGEIMYDTFTKAYYKKPINNLEIDEINKKNQHKK